MRASPFFDVLMGDSRSYDAWAQEIAGGEWLGREGFYQAPLYPYFLGAIYAVIGRDLLVARLIQGLVGASACVLLGVATARLLSRRAGIVGGFGLALYGPAIFAEGLIQKSVLDLFFACLTLWLATCAAVEPDDLARRRSASERGCLSPRLGWWLALGASIGCFSLTRENGLVVAVAVVLWLLVRGRAGRRERVLRVSAFGAGVLMVLAPVAARNAVVGGELHLTTAQFGPNFYIGNSERADGSYVSLRPGRGDPQYERQDATELAARALGRPVTPGEVSRYWAARALDYIRSNPGGWLRLLGRKFALLWNAGELIDTESQAAHAEWSPVLRLSARIGHFGVIVPLALLGAFVSWPQRRRLEVVYLLLASYAASVLVFYVVARYRYPLVPFLIVLASAGVVGAGRAAAMGSRGVALVGLAAAVVFCNWPLVREDLMRAITESNLATALGEAGRRGEAIEHFRRSLVFWPAYAPAHNNLAALLRSEGRLDEAIEHYHQALEAEPGFGVAHYNLANALLEQGRLAEAIDHFRQALGFDPGWMEAWNNLGIALARAGRLDEAVKAFQRALDLAPGSAEVHCNLGNVLVELGRSGEATEHYRRAVGLKPDYFAAHYELGCALTIQSRLLEAIAHLEQAVEIEPESAEAHNALGVALASVGRLEEAREHFEKSLELRSDFDEARQNLRTLMQPRNMLKKLRSGEHGGADQVRETGAS